MSRGRLPVAEVAPATSTRTGPARRPVALRALWAACCAVVLALLAASLPARYAALLHPDDPAVRAGLAQLHLSPGFYAAYHLGSALACAAAFFAVGALIVARRPDRWDAVFVSLTLIAFGAALPGTAYAVISGLPIWDVTFAPLQALGWTLLLLFAYLFPDGRYVQGWARALTPLWVAWVAAFFALAPALAAARPRLVALSFLVWVAWFASGVLAQLDRYLRAAGPAQRQQMKWASLGFFVAIAGALVAVVPHIAALTAGQPERTGLLYQLLATALLALAALAFPLAIGVAMLRHRLFDVDFIINRTLVYALLTGALAAIYAGCVLAIQLLLDGLGGHTARLALSGSPPALAVSTLATAAVFRPMRGRIQAQIDRRLYRSKYDAARTLDAFGATLRHEVDLAQLTEQLLAVIQRTMEPAHVSLWLRRPPPGPRPGSAPVVVESPAVVEPPGLPSPAAVSVPAAPPPVPGGGAE